MIDTSNKIRISNMLSPHHHHVEIVAISNSRKGVEEEATIRINNNLGIIHGNINRHCIITRWEGWFIDLIVQGRDWASLSSAIFSWDSSPQDDLLFELTDCAIVLPGWLARV